MRLSLVNDHLSEAKTFPKHQFRSSYFLLNEQCDLSFLFHVAEKTLLSMIYPNLIRIIQIFCNNFTEIVVASRLRLQFLTLPSQAEQSSYIE